MNTDDPRKEDEAKLRAIRECTDPLQRAFLEDDLIAPEPPQGDAPEGKVKG